jgi:hypothetical protein
VRSISTSSYLQNSDSSADGYIRLTFSTFLAIQFDHRLAWLDNDLRNELVLEDVPAFRAGYCEWVAAAGPPQVSVGWAWFALSNDGQVFLAPGGISSNVMVVNSRGHDLGMRKTDALLHAWLSSHPWQPSDISPSLDKFVQGSVTY